MMCIHWFGLLIVYITLTECCYANTGPSSCPLMIVYIFQGRSASRTTAAANSIGGNGRNDHKHIRRSAAAILPKKKGAVYWKGRRVK